MGCYLLAKVAPRRERTRLRFENGYFIIIFRFLIMSMRLSFSRQGVRMRSNLGFGNGPEFREQHIKLEAGELVSLKSRYILVLVSQRLGMQAAF